MNKVILFFMTLLFTLTVKVQPNTPKTFEEEVKAYIAQVHTDPDDANLHEEFQKLNQSFSNTDYDSIFKQFLSFNAPEALAKELYFGFSLDIGAFNNLWPTKPTTPQKLELPYLQKALKKTMQEWYRNQGNPLEKIFHFPRKAHVVFGGAGAAGTQILSQLHAKTAKDLDWINLELRVLRDKILEETASTDPENLQSLLETPSTSKRLRTHILLYQEKRKLQNKIQQDLVKWFIGTMIAGAATGASARAHYRATPFDKHNISTS